MFIIRTDTKIVGVAPNREWAESAASNGQFVEEYSEKVNPKHLKILNGVVSKKSDAEIMQQVNEERRQEAWRRLRLKRDKVLSATDWTQVPDTPVDKQAWATYRQALRDLPQNTTDPREVVWPTPPQ